MGFRGMRLVVHVRGFGGMKFTHEILSEYLNAVCSRRLKNNIRTYLGYFGSGISICISLTQYIGQLCNTQFHTVSP